LTEENIESQSNLGVNLKGNSEMEKVDFGYYLDHNEYTNVVDQMENLKGTGIEVRPTMFSPCKTEIYLGSYRATVKTTDISELYSIFVKIPKLYEQQLESGMCMDINKLYWLEKDYYTVGNLLYDKDVLSDEQKCFYDIKDITKRIMLHEKEPQNQE